MNEINNEMVTVETLPKPVMRKRSWTLSLVWIVPLLAAVYATYLLFHHFESLGPKITIHFSDASDMKINQTQLRLHGVPVGTVVAVNLSQDFKRVIVTAQLHRANADLAKKGTQFWVVQPELGDGNISGLGTVFSGPYIDMIPGSGENASDFVGLERVPFDLGKGLRITLHSSHLGSLKRGSPVFYRGIEVGLIESSELGHDATAVDIHAFIKREYQPLVVNNSKFWNVSGVDVNGGLLSGVTLKIESLRSLLAGGVEFATPGEDRGAPVKDGAQFELHDELKSDWLTWTPIIPLKADPELKPNDKNIEFQQEKEVIGSAIGKK